MSLAGKDHPDVGRQAAASASRSRCGPPQTVRTSRCSRRPTPRIRSSRATIHTAAEQIRAAGGQALPIVGDVRDDDDITEAVMKDAG